MKENDCKCGEKKCNNNCCSWNCPCKMKANSCHRCCPERNDLDISGRVVVNPVVDKVPCGTTIYSSNECNFKNQNNIMLLDTFNKKKSCSNSNHSIFLGRNVAKNTEKNDVLAEFGGISSESNNINGSIKFIAKEDFKCHHQSTKANIELNNKCVANFQEINGTPNVGTATLTLSVFINCPPDGNFKEGTLALLKVDNKYTLIVFDGRNWVQV